MPAVGFDASLPWLMLIVRLQATYQNSPMLFAGRSQVEAYVEGALREATPEGWTFERSSSTDLWWTIRRVSIPPGEWDWQDYHLHVTGDLHWFILTYGNDDRGLISLSQALQSARVIPASSLEVFSLSDCIRYVITHCKPNEWGYT